MGNISLRRKLYKKAIEDEDSRMLIFLAKNWLDMSDKQETRLLGSEDNPVNINTAEEYDFSNLTDEELEQFHLLAEKARKKKNNVSVSNRN